LKNIGIIWDPAQPNSQISERLLSDVCASLNMKLVSITANKVSDLPDATRAICQRGVDIIVLSADNLTISGFPAIRAIAQKAGIPIYATEPGLVKEGARAAIGDDYFEWGKQSGRIAAKVLAGVSPSNIQVEKTDVQKKVVSSTGKNGAGKK